MPVDELHFLMNESILKLHHVYRIVLGTMGNTELVLCSKGASLETAKQKHMHN